MAKKKAKHNQPPRRPTIIRRDVDRPEIDAAMQPLIDGLKQAYYQGPLQFVQSMSILLEALDPRWDPPIKPFTREEFVRTLMRVDLIATTAALHGLVAMMPDDEPLVDEMRAVLASRAHNLPAWLTSLGASRTIGVHRRQLDPGGGGSYLIDLQLGDGTPLLGIVLVEVSDRTIAANGFMVPMSWEEFRAMAPGLDDPGVEVIDVPADEARSILLEALGPLELPIESSSAEQWPSVRPLLEWATRLLPDG